MIQVKLHIKQIIIYVAKSLHTIKSPVCILSDDAIKQKSHMVDKWTQISRRYNCIVSQNKDTLQ